MPEDKQRLNEIKDLLTTEPKELKKEVSIIFDGKQYTLRIPKNLAEKADINPKTDKFLFMLSIPSKQEEEMRLRAEFIRVNKDAKEKTKAKY